MGLGFHICFSGLGGVMQLTVRATFPNFAFLAVFCAVGGPSPRGTVSSQRDSKPNPDAGDQSRCQGPSIKAWIDEIATKADPGRPPKMANLTIFGILTPHGDPLARRCQGI